MTPLTYEQAKDLALQQLLEGMAKEIEKAILGDPRPGEIPIITSEMLQKFAEDFNAYIHQPGQQEAFRAALEAGTRALMEPSAPHRVM